MFLKRFMYFFDQLAFTPNLNPRISRSQILQLFAEADRRYYSKSSCGVWIDYFRRTTFLSDSRSIEGECNWIEKKWRRPVAGVCGCSSYCSSC